MKAPAQLEGYYFQQGYNYVDYAPDNSIKLGGGCQASSLLMAVRLLTRDTSFSMKDISDSAVSSGKSFLDIDYATRISYPTISLVASSMLKTHKVILLLETTAEKIKSNKLSKTFYANEADNTYLNKPKVSNLEFEFGIDSKAQTEMAIQTLKSGGLILPLVHPNTLYGTDNKNTEDFLHCVVAVEYDSVTNRIRIIDPSIGFSQTDEFKTMKDSGILKIKADQIKDMKKVNEIASKFHPMKSVDYWVSVFAYEKSLRYCSTLISL